MTFDNLLKQTIREAIREELAVLRDEFEAIKTPTPIMEEYLSTNQAAKILGLHPETIRLMVRDGRLPRREVAGNFRFMRSDIEKLLNVGLSQSTSDEVTDFLKKAVIYGPTTRNH